MGQPHNMVRHPDMPREAFADMWATLKQGESWTALVKNRCKNGDHYWVRANATPVVRGGQVQGYMSVRTRPSREEVQGAEQLYQRFREGRAGSLAFHKGLVVHQGLSRWRSVFQLMSLRWRLAMGPLLITIFSIACGLLAGLNHTQLAWLMAADVVAAGLGLFLVVGPLNADIQQEKRGGREEKDTPKSRENIRRATEIPTPQDQVITVLRGVPAEIVLSATASLRQPVIFRLGEGPSHGTVSSLRPSAESNTKAVVTYTAGPGTAGSDVFTFRVRHRETATSGSASVRVRIMDPQAELVVPAEVNFGEVAVGEVAVDTAR